MTRGLVLSLFPGLDVLGMGFEAEGFAVVAGPDVVWGRDIHDFHPPTERFDGVIGGPPCQTFSTLANLVRAKGLEPRFGNLIPEFVRVIEEAAPAWFLMENVPGVPEHSWPRPEAYAVTTFVVDNCWLDGGDGFGEEQMRKRRFWFGWQAEKGEAPDLGNRLRFCALELPRAVGTVVAGHDQAPGQRDRVRRQRQAVSSADRAVPVKLGGSGRVKRTAVTGGSDGRIGSAVVETARRKRRAVAQNGVNNSPEKKRRQPSVTGRNHSNGMGSAHPGNPPKYSIDEMLRLQGLDAEVLDHAPFTMQAKRKLVGNAVPLGMARQLAAAVAEVVGETVA